MFGRIPPVKLPSPGLLFAGRFFIKNSISLLMTSLFRLFLPDSDLKNCIVLEICPFLLGYPICCHINVVFSYDFFKSLWYPLLFLLFHFLLCIFGYSIFFLMSLVMAYLFVSLFKKLALGFINLFHFFVCVVSILFISSLIFIISFLLTWALFFFFSLILLDGTFISDIS